MFNIDLNDDLLSLVEGKRVVVVGPAPYLAGHGAGKEIDSYDIVVRPNAFAPPSSLRKDYGSRTDVMFHNLGTPWQEGLKEQIKKNEDSFKKLKLVGCLATKSDHSETNFLNWPEDYVSNVVRNFKEVNKYNIPFYWIGNVDYRKLYRRIGVEPNTGIMSIAVLLHYPVKEIFVTGFSFYLQGNTHDTTYYDGFLPEADKEIYNGRYGVGHGAHANNVQIEFFKTLIKENSSVIKADKTIKTLLELQ
mgnify:CR=1 FL=1|tara:strand:- start:12545 stop:13285 length:741 start_codon:yes stop_codon:yes gene_type:complete